MLWLFEFPGEGSQTTVGLSTTAFFIVFAGYFFGNLKGKANHILNPLLSVIPKCVTLNSYFPLNSVFAQVGLAYDRATFENNCLKSNEDRHILSAAQ